MPCQARGNSAAAVRPRKRRLDFDDSSEDEENRHPASPYKASRKHPRVHAASRPSAERRDREQNSVERRERERNSERSNRREAARGAVTVPRNSSTPQRGPSDRLSFSSSSDDGRRHPGSAGPSQGPARNGYSQVSGRTKNLFTDEEVQAIREGVARFGVGEWQKIKVNSNGRLLARSAVQIKDKYRNMVRTGQI
jgi:Myb-like DNA-binding domain